MKIATRVAILVILPLVLGVTIIAIQFWASMRVDQALMDQQRALEIVRGVSELGLLTFELDRPYSAQRARRQWEKKHEDLTRLLAEARRSDPDVAGIFNRLDRQMRDIADLPARLSAPAVTPTFRATVFDWGLVKTQSIEADGLRLGRLSAMQVAKIRRITDNITLAVIGILVLFMSLAAVLMRRSILRPLARLHHGTIVVGDGNLDYRVGNQAHDELGRLSRAFDEMTARLQETMASREELERSNRDLDDFAYVASHDLKEPLRGMHNYAGFLLEDYASVLPEDGHQKLQTLQRLAARMEELIDALLRYSRVGRRDLTMAWHDPRDILDEALESIQTRLDEGDDVEVLGTLPHAWCDRIRVGEVFQNLISNALKYNDKPAKRVEVGCLGEAEPTAHPVPPGHNVYWVRDNGIGIREKHVDAVFRIFKRLHGRDKYGGGTGAGLTITRKIIERHGGAIWVESVKGEGSTFYFTLPAEEGEGHDDNRP